MVGNTEHDPLWANLWEEVLAAGLMGLGDPSLCPPLSDSGDIKAHGGSGGGRWGWGGGEGGSTSLPSSQLGRSELILGEALKLKLG